MSNIKFNLSKLEINIIITEALKIYPSDLLFFKQEISIPKENFIFKSYINYYQMDISKYSMIRYMALFNGHSIYDFYVINSIEKCVENIFI